MANVAETKVRITLDDNLSGGLKNIESGLSRLQTIVTGIAINDFGLGRVGELFTSQVKAGYDLGVKMETARMSISGVLLSMTKLKDRNLEWNEALGMSDKIINDLQKKAMITASTPTELVDTFSGLLGVGLGAGMSVEEIQKLTVVGANAVKSFGLQGYQLIQEMRDLFAGTITTRASTVARSLNITNEDIKKAKEQGKLYEFLSERMKGFEEVVQHYGETYQGAMTIAQGASEQLLSQGLEPLRMAVRDIANDFTNSIITYGADGSPEFVKEYKDAVVGIGEGLGKSAKGFTDLIGKVGSLVAKFTPFSGVLDTVAGNIDTIVIGMLAWQTYNRRIVLESQQLASTQELIARNSSAFTSDLEKQAMLTQRITANRVEQETANYPKVGLQIAEVTEQEKVARAISKARINYSEDAHTSAMKSVKEIEKVFSNKIREIVRAKKEVEELEILSNKVDAAHERFVKSYKNMNTGERNAEQISKMVDSLVLADKEALQLKRHLFAIGKMGNFGDVKRAFNDYFEGIRAVNEQNAGIEKFNRSIDYQVRKLVELGATEKEIGAISKQANAMFLAGKEAEAKAIFKNAIAETERINARNAEINKFNNSMDTYVGKLAKLGVAERDIVTLRTKANQLYLAGNEEEARSLMRLATEQAKIVDEENKRIANINKWSERLSILGSTSLALGQIFTTIGDKMESDFFKKIGDGASTIGILTFSINQLSYALKMLKLTNPELLALTALAGTVAYVGDKMLTQSSIEEEAKKLGVSISKYRKVGGDIGDDDSLFVETDYEALQKAIKDKLTALSNANQTTPDMSKLLLKYGVKGNGDVNTESNSYVKKLENLAVLQADVRAKTAKLTSTAYEAEVATLEKEFQQMVDKANDIARATKQDVSGVIADIEAYKSVAMRNLDNKNVERQHETNLKLIEADFELGRTTLAEKNELDAQEYQSHMEWLQRRLNEEYSATHVNLDEIAKLQQQYAEAYKKLQESMSTDLEIHWDRVIEHIKNITFDQTATLISGLDTMIGRFTDFGQNIVTEGANVSERLRDLAKNLANDISNMMMKLYMQGLMMKLFSGLFGGGSGGISGADFGLGAVPTFASGGIAQGWSIVGERGAELVNFSNPGRVYTADQTAQALSGGNGKGVNIKFELKNETGTPMQAQQTESRFDGENYIIGVVLNAYANNRNGMRSIMQGAR